MTFGLHSNLNPHLKKPRVGHPKSKARSPPKQPPNKIKLKTTANQRTQQNVLAALCGRGTGLPQVAGDDHALDFAGAFVNCKDAGVAVHALYRGLAGVPYSAVDLDGFGGDAIGHFAGIE